MATKVFRDPVHQYIHVSASGSYPEINLIDSPWFQRLRHCSQHGPARLVYPSLLGTRFEHSLGVMELAGKMTRSILNRDKYPDESVVNNFLNDCTIQFKAALGDDVPGTTEQVLIDVMRWAGLCHDLGHFPLSHTFEASFTAAFWAEAIPSGWDPPRNCHEVISADIVRYLAFSDQKNGDARLLPRWLARAVILVLLAPKEAQIELASGPIPLEASVFYTLSYIINGNLDADNLDYLQRDGRISGTNFGLVDPDRFVESLSLFPKEKTIHGNNYPSYEIWPNEKALSTVEAALLERYKEFKWVCFHPKALFFDAVTQELCTRLLGQVETKKLLFSPFPNSKLTPLIGTIKAKQATTIDAKCRNQLYKVLTHPTPENDEILADLPFSLYRDGMRKKNPKTHKYHFLNYSNLVNTPLHFFDDIWLCHGCRTLKPKPDGNFYIDTLVERRKNSIAAWKGLPGYTEFFKIVEGLLPLQEYCKGVLDTWAHEESVVNPSSAAAARWLEWILTTGFPNRVTHLMLSEMRYQIEQVCQEFDIPGLRCYVVLPPWKKLMSDPGKMRFVCSDKKLRPATEMSNLLHAVATIKGEVPIFVSFACEYASFDKLVGQQKVLMGKAAAGLAHYIKKFLADEKQKDDKTKAKGVSVYSLFRAEWIRGAKQK